MRGLNKHTLSFSRYPLFSRWLELVSRAYNTFTLIALF